MEKEEQLDLLKIGISIILFLIGMLSSNKTISVVGYVLSYIVISYEMYIKSFHNIKKGEIFDENFLMILATLGAFYIKSYEEGVLVILLFQIGEFLSDLAVSKSKDSITKLMDLRAEELLLEDNSTIPVEKAKIGDIFLVKPGDKIPLDGIVLEGKSHVDTSSITGESTPRSVKENDSIWSGCINKTSILKIKATTNYKTSTVQKILELLEEEEEKRANTDKWITKFAKVYTPIIIILSALILIIPVLLGGNPNEWLYRTLIFIVTSCPCALVISVPLGYFCGLGKASKEGILIKGAKELETLSEINTILFDKTGTLTEGVMKVSKVNTEMDKKEFLEIMASAEASSLHPIANAILEKNKEPLKKVTEYKELAGRGISCKIGKKEIIVGNSTIMEDENISFEKEKSVSTVVYMSINHKYVGNVILSDELKESSKSIKELKLEKAILSGDNEEIVKSVANSLQIENYYGQLLPEDKVRILKEYKEKGKVLFIGDGINDAPVLRLADIGVSLGKIGTDAALEASDVVLMQDDLSKIKEAIDISKYTNRKVKQSIALALVVKVIVLLLGVLGKSTIIMAVFADVGVTLLAVLNVLCIFLHKKKKTN